MEIALTTIAVLGGLLFFFSYIKYILSGFRYHPVTGILAMLPVINLITLPTLLDDKLTRTLFVGIFGLIFAGGAWFLGADKSLQKHISVLRGQPPIQASAPQQNTSKEHITSNSTAINQVKTEGQTQAIIEPQAVYLEALPKKALYSLEFIDTPVEQITTLQGRIVRITSRKDILFEGRINKISVGSVFISKRETGAKAYEILVGNIKQLKVMVKRHHDQDKAKS